MRIPGLLRELAGLFFDDGSLAIVVLVILAATAVLLDAAWLEPAAAMAFLVAGSSRPPRWPSWWPA